MRNWFRAGLVAGSILAATVAGAEAQGCGNAVPFRWLQKRWAAHSVHHRLVATNFGVTTSFWDHVFATHYQSRKR